METLHEGLFIMIMGMTTVFVFLIILMFTVNFCSKLMAVLNRYFPEQIDEPKNKIKKNDNNEEIAIAIACAAKKGGRYDT